MTSETYGKEYPNISTLGRIKRHDLAKLIQDNI